METDDEFICRVFIAALRVGYALQGRPDPIEFHRRDIPEVADRPGADEKLWKAMEAVKAGLGLWGNTPDELVKSLSLSGASAWKREALAKVIRAFPLTQKHDPLADQQALDLLGQAVWDIQAALPKLCSERFIKDVWPVRPVTAEATNA